MLAALLTNLDARSPAAPDYGVSRRRKRQERAKAFALAKEYRRILRAAEADEESRKRAEEAEKVIAPHKGRKRVRKGGVTKIVPEIRWDAVVADQPTYEQMQEIIRAHKNRMLLLALLMDEP